MVVVVGAGAGAGKRSLCMLNLLLSVSSEWKLLWNTHTMHSPHHCGNPVSHARWRRNHDGWVETFTVFSYSLLTLTRVHLLPPLSHKLLLCLGACGSLGDRMGTTVQSHSHTQRLPLSLTSHGAAACASRQTRISSQWLCFSLRLSLPTSFQENEKPTKKKSRIRSSGWFLIKADR